MCLVHPADRKGFHNPLVHPLALVRFFCIERTLVLIDHDSVFMKGIITVSVKFLCKQSFARSERIRGISTRYYAPRLHAGVFALPVYVEELLKDVEEKRN